MNTTEGTTMTTPRKYHRDDCALHLAPQECECNCGVDSPRCFKCDAPDVTGEDEDDNPLCGRCYSALPEIDDCWAYSV